MPKLWGLVPAAGVGRRMGFDIPKQYLPLRGKSILEHSLNGLLAHPQITAIMVVLAKDDAHWPSVQKKFPPQKLLTTVGAEERYLSVYQGLLALEAIAEPQDWVLVHDAVRPFLALSDLERLIATLSHHAIGGLLGLRVNDTLKRSNEQGLVVATIDRHNIWQAQTPQMFRFSILRKALEQVITKGLIVSDDASAVELLGEPVLMVEGRRDNIKITRPEDLEDVHAHRTWF